jgi:hypothetical protein
VSVDDLRTWQGVVLGSAVSTLRSVEIVWWPFSYLPSSCPRYQHVMQLGLLNEQLRDQYVLLVFVAHLHHLALVVSVAQLLLKLSLRMALHDTIDIFQDSMRAKFQE